MSIVINGGHLILKRAPRRGDKLVIVPSHGTHHVLALPLFAKKLNAAVTELDLLEAVIESADTFSLDIEELDSLSASIEDC